ncbi:MAG: hypothetical protein BIP78_0593 [Candidatus Bipolaricaulis sibiricus]|uniref:Polysaccharide chain length determinant N-terminal domain-containing protein n=1 Tax=Bipolaricaulis sibiricus TaxID=2501609 RepID=A0A410FT37_BIPS1|nr:MAG: hypothetical protein BIP78_0593 [Candidatus Bipolaricaulis sibiricus]
MDEYEVDLREYVRILWKGKWIVAGVLAVALVVAGVVTARAPVEHRAEVLLAVETPAGMPRGYSLPTAARVAERVKDPNLLSRVVLPAGVSPAWITAALEARVQGAFVQVALQGTRPAAEVGAILAGVLDALRADLAAGVAEAADRRLGEVDAARDALRARLTAWEEELDEMRAAAEASRDRLRGEIARVSNDPELLSLSVGTEATVRGYLVQKELDLLYARLQQVELALDGMERQGEAYVAGAAWKNTAEQLAALDQEEAVLRRILEEPPGPLSVVRGPALSDPLRPSLKMNLAVAGVLGLFVGVLLVFFIHALQAPENGRRDLPMDERPGPTPG